MPAEVHRCQEGFRVSVAGAPQGETGCPRVLYLCTEEPTEPPRDCAPAKDGRAGGDRLDCNLSPLTSRNRIGMVQEEREVFSTSGCLEQISRAQDKARSLHP